jgi:hypothetical protein
MPVPWLINYICPVVLDLRHQGRARLRLRLVETPRRLASELVCQRLYFRKGIEIFFRQKELILHATAVLTILLRA